MRRLPSRPRNWTEFLGLPAYNFREAERGTEYKRDTEFPLLPKMWTRLDDEGYLDAGEATDDEIFDLR